MSKPVTNGRWTRVYDFRPDGHAFFEDRDTGRIAVADQSGDWPDQTDDGILWLDTNRPVVFGNNNTACVPLLTDYNNETTHTPESYGRAIETAWRFGMQVEFTGDMSRFAQVFSWMVSPNELHPHVWDIEGGDIKFN